MPSIRERQSAWSALTSTASETDAVAKAAAARIAEIKADDTLSDSYKQTLIKQVQEKTAATVDAARQGITAARETLLASAGELSNPGGDTTAQLLAETRQQRAWSRILPQLNAGRALPDILAEAVNAKDGAAVLALAAEAPAWAQANRPRSSGLNRLTQGELDLTNLRQSLDVATARVLGDDQGHGTAALLRLHVAAHHPVAVAQLDQAANGLTLRSTFAVKLARQSADGIAAQLAGGDQAASDGGDGGGDAGSGGGE